MSYELQLLLGLVSLALFGGVFYRWQTDHVLSPVGQLCVVIGFMAALIILPFGSLRLMQVIDDDLWWLTGTLLRVVVVVCAFAALLTQEE